MLILGEKKLFLRNPKLALWAQEEGQRPLAPCATINIIFFAGHQFAIVTFARILENSEKQTKPWNNATIYNRMQISKSLIFALWETGVFFGCLYKITIVLSFCCLLVQSKGWRTQKIICIDLDKCPPYPNLSYLDHALLSIHSSHGHSS